MPCQDKFRQSNNCGHERHLEYLGAFWHLWSSGFVEFITKYILDPNISPDDTDDLELFQDFVFSKRLGRLHIFYYENLLNNKPHPSDELAKAFCRYFDFLSQISPFFAKEALNFVFREQRLEMIELIFNSSSYKMKMEMLKVSDNFPEKVKRIPKLKLYNLFS
jgi:hypothetical protein